ncbi:hypothetical protein L1I30_02700 [Gillisia sp. M10.2A]|uniref:Uncharacterized protein n=1 Tax=Gillisia lutea TaxID=2909668 RepID=A0ABS9EE83_9FLAO|nr:hypothetical protein [Gillisia lutea]MCF4100567.1 hypothetical protein [Gillisia lutea]
MPLQIGIPKDQQPRPEQEWGFTIWEFIIENKWYLAGILLLLAIFFYARNYMKNH